MKAKRTDRRVQKTLKLLHEALMALVLEKNYESISVQEILDRANVGRSTFYTHYQDKDDLLLRAFDGLQVELKAAQAHAPLVPGRSFEKIIGFSEAMFRHAHGFRQIYASLIRSHAGAIVRQRLNKIIEDLIREEFNRESARRKKSATPFPDELLIHYLSSTFLSVLTWWAQDRSDRPPEFMNSMYRSLVLPVLESNFKR